MGEMKNMTNYKDKYEKLDKLPEGLITEIYIVPSHMYDRILGK